MKKWMIIVTILSLLFAGVGSSMAEGIPCRNHAFPFDFMFDNHFDTHQQTKLNKDGEIFGFLYITDGGLLNKPYQQSELLLSLGERVDILVKGTQNSGNYRLRALPRTTEGVWGIHLL